MTLILPAALEAQIAAEARAAFPRECCGLIEGTKQDDVLRAIALHPAPNLAAARDRFVLDPQTHIAAHKAVRQRGHVLIGCYHSHPAGQAQPSAADLAGAAEEDFVWLIAASDGADCSIKAFVYRDGGFDAIALTVGADFVTSS